MKLADLLDHLREMADRARTLEDRAALFEAMRRLRHSGDSYVIRVPSDEQTKFFTRPSSTPAEPVAPRVIGKP